MTIPNRTLTLTGVFAKNATTTIPDPPVSGASYRDTQMTKEEVESGWAYKDIVDSSSFNQAMYEYASLTSQMEKYGFLPWSNLTDYVAGSICLGSDGNLYQAIQATGPSSTAYDPVNDTSHTYWVAFLQAAMSLILGSVYPVGSIYIGTQTTCPLETLITGSTWEIVATDKALWGGNGSNGNTTIDAGLPNITGSFNFDKPFCNGATASGAINTSTAPIRGHVDGAGGAGGGFTFDASRSSSIYGNSTTVQPPAYRLNVWRRTA